jgi:hypothetical protein
MTGRATATRALDHLTGNVGVPSRRRAINVARATPQCSRLNAAQLAHNDREVVPESQPSNDPLIAPSAGHLRPEETVSPINYQCL